MESDDILFKVIIVGDSGVGKSSLLQQYVTKQFKAEYAVTLGVEFQQQQIQIDESTKVTLQIWDSAGQESFRSIVRSFYRRSAAVFLVYDVKKKQSLASIEEWLADARENGQKKQVTILVGNQNDAEYYRQVTYEEGQNFQKENNINLFFETSAKTGDNVQKAFEETAKMIFLNYMQEQMEQQNEESLNLNELKGSELKTNQRIEAKSQSCC